MSIPQKVLVYGSYGYSGTLIVKQAHKKGVPMVLSGRNGKKCSELAKQIGLDPIRDTFSFSVDCLESVASALDIIKKVHNIKAVMNVAGPYRDTFENIVEGCIRSGIHYFDVTGEIDVFKKAVELNERAKNSGILILNGCGMGYVPVDCMSLHLKKNLPTADHLEIALHVTGGVSRGTARTILNEMESGNMVLENGELVPASYSQRKVPIFRGKDPVPATLIKGGDLISASFTTKIDSIKTYMCSGSMIADWSIYLSSFLAVKKLMSFIPKSIMYKFVPENGPDHKTIQKSHSNFYVEAIDTRNNVKIARRLKTSSGYKLTALSASEVMKRIVVDEYLEENPGKTGFQTAATLFGPDFIFEVDPDAEMEDVV